MKPPYRKRWWHDPDVRELVLAGAVALAATVLVVARDWWVARRGQETGVGGQGVVESRAVVQGQIAVESRESRVESQRKR